MERKAGMSKPPYKVPSMADIRGIPWNGYSVVSTFSGCGGSCLGYRMAGFRVLWASEFVEAAQKVYKLNHPDSILDMRDIRTVQPEDILKATGKEQGEIDLLDGSPPCASFSRAGKREKSWGAVKQYSDTKQRTDDLFFEYARILEGLQPRVFVAENVAGLVKGTAKGYFKIILARLKECGYNVRAKVLDAQWLGVPQTRGRVIFIGVREDLGVEPAFPKPLPYRYSVRDALPWILKQRDNAGFGGGAMREAVSPSPSIGASPQTGNASLEAFTNTRSRVAH
jgi:DNA (cytosine-5)-methyltransferase 1